MNSEFRLQAQFAALRSNLRPFATYLLVSLAFTTLARAGLSLWQFERVSATGGWIWIFLQGIRFDFVLQGMLLAVPLSLMPLLLAFPWTRNTSKTLLPVILASFTVLIVFMEIATPAFVLEYDLRPNVLFVKYLEYPREVAAMLFTGYWPQLLFAAIVLPVVAWFSWRAYTRRAAFMVPTSIPFALAIAPVLLLACAVAWRSSFDHRPVNPSDVAFSTDPLVNMLPLPSAYSALYGLHELGREDAGIRYGDMPEQEVIAIMRQMSGLPADAFTSQTIPTLHRQPVTASGRKNLVILLEESLGAGFVGALGGLPLTPELDRLAQDGIWFSNMHATGTRSIRGIEAVVTGFLPTTTESVVKLGGAQRGFFTLAELLQNAGYTTSFIYGGSAQFDNMRRFFVGNGFETIIEQDDFTDPVYAGSWGVSDEDLVNRADQYFDSLPKDKPFFSLVFSTSNHSPFEYPAGRISPYNEPANTRENAIKYADYAIGKFIAAARRSDYWDNTVFLIVADHDSRVGGAELVPVQRYHIPALILGGGIEPRRIERVASQVDLIPTLVPMLGVEAEHPGTGLDLLADYARDVPPHAVMQYSDNIAYRERDTVVVFQSGKPATQFSYVDHSLVPAATVDPDLYRRALAHTEWPRIAYHNRWYRLPESAN